MDKDKFIDYLKKKGFKYIEDNSSVKEKDYYINKNVFVKFFDNSVKVTLLHSSLGISEYSSFDEFTYMIDFLLTIHE